MECVTEAFILKLLVGLVIGLWIVLVVGVAHTLLYYYW